MSIALSQSLEGYWRVKFACWRVFGGGLKGDTHSFWRVANTVQIAPLKNIVNYVLSTEDSELWYRGTMLRF